MPQSLKPRVLSQWKGPVLFQESLRLQEDMKPSAQKGRGFFLGFESRNNVITMGLRATKEDILWSETDLKKHNIETIPLKRGGRATLHAPGQLVIYPVFCLSFLNRRIKDFILLLEQITKDCLQELGVLSERREKYSGLSTPRGKIAFFGIHVSEDVSQHGLAVNVKNDLRLFNSIKSCGVAERSHDSLQKCNVPLSTKELFDKWVRRASPFFEL